MLLEKAIAYENTSYKGLFHFVRYIDKLQKYDVDFGEADMTSENDDVVRIMSIHKSKGLEFPVVFVSGLGKNFNRQDTRSRMVLHPELGIGLDCMDGVRRVKTPTIVKRAIAKQIDLENLGEELRVLYVALTRAKEKLILTGAKKQAEELLERLNISAEMDSVTGGEHQALSYLLRESASGYLDWLLPAFAACHGKYDCKVVSVAELAVAASETVAGEVLDGAARMEAVKHADPELLAELAGHFAFSYPHQGNLTRKNKYSVSELKHRAMRELLEQEEEELKPAFMQEDIVPYKPAFVQRMETGEESVNQGALRVRRCTASWNVTTFLPMRLPHRRWRPCSRMERSLRIWQLWCACRLWKRFLTPISGHV